MYLYLVLIIGLIALVFFAFFFSTVIQYTQEAFNPYLTATSWASEDHYNVFYLASTALTNVWTYVFVFAFFGLMYYAYIYTQRRGVA